MLTYTYDLATTIGLARLYAGDNDPNSLSATGGERTRTDAEISALLVQCGNDPVIAAAQVLESKAAQFAVQAVYTVSSANGVDYRARSTRLLEAAAALRAGCLNVAFNSPQRDAPFTVGPGGTMEDW